MKILVQRDYNGIGDWLFALAALKMLNRQVPDAEAFVTFETKTQLPKLVPQAFAASDVRHKIGMPDGEFRHAHNLVYRKRPPELYLESVVADLNDRCGTRVQFEPGVYPDWGVRPERGDYIAMVGHGKRIDTVGKDWGHRNFEALAKLVAKRMPVVQVGGQWDRQLKYATRKYLGDHFERTVRVIAGARAFIGIENGLMVLAGFLGVPQMTIYNGWPMASRSDYAGQIKIADPITPENAAARVFESFA